MFSNGAFSLALYLPSTERLGMGSPEQPSFQVRSPPDDGQLQEAETASLTSATCVTSCFLLNLLTDIIYQTVS